MCIHDDGFVNVKLRFEARFFDMSASAAAG